ncbi:MAG: TolC family protein [Deltaproteobacteria bacterium]|nr:MAG: TolC family protein [Deltaproteobacteria bacterium]
MARLLVTLVVPACALVRPVNVTPPPAPPAFVAAFEAGPSRADGAVNAPGSAPGSVERATHSAVWWSAFADPALDGAIQEALRNNYFIRDVRTLIYENMLDPATPRGWWWPLQVGIPATTPANVQHIVTAVAGSKPTALTYNAANIDLTASYQLDLWGHLDAQRRVADDLVEQQRENTEVASQNLAEQVSQLWFDILVQRTLKDLTEGEVRYNQELFDLIKARFEQHLTPRLVVLQQEQQLLNIRSQVPLITARIAILNSQLTALLGRMPNPRDELVPADRRLPDLPSAPGLGAPGDLSETTAEMRLARLRVTEIENRKNENLSSWLPTIELLGSAGIVSFGSSETFTEGFAGVRLTWPLFDGARRITEAKQLELTLKRRKWQYELALKTAIGRVQDALLQEANQAESLRSLRAQAVLGRQVLEEARRLFEQGQSDYLPVLTALASLASLERAGLLAQRLLLSYRVQLYRALGGTWSYEVTKLPN